MSELDKVPVAGLIAGSAALVAVASSSVAPEPVLTLLGSAAGIALLLARGGRARPIVTPAPCGSPLHGMDLETGLFRRVRRSGSGGEQSTASPADDDENPREIDQTDESPKGNEAPSTLSYEEFTAKVAEESETEEISFLPPYASGASSPTPSDTGAASNLAEQVEAAANDTAQADSKMPVPRHFALGTVAVIRKLLEPAEVERILAEQRRYPRLRFGDIAMQLGVLTESQIQELLLAQQQGVFTDAEIRDARDRLKEFRQQAGAAGER